MRQSDYNLIFETWARRHKDILHSDEECHFLKMTLSTDHVARVLDLGEFYASLKNKLDPGYFMALQTYEADYEDNGGDHRRKVYHGAMLIMKKVDDGDFAGQAEVLDKSEEIGEDIMAAVLDQFKGTNKIWMTANDINGAVVGPVGDNFWGNRFDFSFKAPANGALKFKPEKFLNL